MSDPGSLPDLLELAVDDKIAEINESNPHSRPRPDQEERPDADRGLYVVTITRLAILVWSRGRPVQ